MDDPFRAAFEESGDADAYAPPRPASWRDSSVRALPTALDASRPKADRHAASRELWATARRLIVADPRAVSPSYRLVTGLIRRTVG